MPYVLVTAGRLARYGRRAYDRKPEGSIRWNEVAERVGSGSVATVLSGRRARSSRCSSNRKSALNRGGWRIETVQRERSLHSSVAERRIVDPVAGVRSPVRARRSSDATPSKECIQGRAVGILIIRQGPAFECLQTLLARVDFPLPAVTPYSSVGEQRLYTAMVRGSNPCGATMRSGLPTPLRDRRRKVRANGFEASAARIARVASWTLSTCPQGGVLSPRLRWCGARRRSPCRAADVRGVVAQRRSGCTCHWTQVRILPTPPLSRCPVRARGVQLLAGTWSADDGHVWGPTRQVRVLPPTLEGSASGGKPDSKPGRGESPEVRHLYLPQGATHGATATGAVPSHAV